MYTILTIITMHAYVVSHTSQQSITVELVDRNVYHAHVLSDGLNYITLNIHSFTSPNKSYYNPILGILLIYLEGHYHQLGSFN